MGFSNIAANALSTGACEYLSSKVTNSIVTPFFDLCCHNLKMNESHLDKLGTPRICSSRKKKRTVGIQTFPSRRERRGALNQLICFIVMMPYIRNLY
jgi:hypothetical protein